MLFIHQRGARARQKRPRGDARAVPTASSLLRASKRGTHLNLTRHTRLVCSHDTHYITYSKQHDASADAPSTSGRPAQADGAAPAADVPAAASSSAAAAAAAAAGPGALSAADQQQQQQQRRVSSFPVDDLAPYASSVADAPPAMSDVDAAGAGAAGVAGAAGMGGAGVASGAPRQLLGARPPKLKLSAATAGAGAGAGTLAGSVASRQDVDLSGADIAAHRPRGAAKQQQQQKQPAAAGATAASRLTERNVGSLNAAFEARRARASGADDADALTIVTVNRYTYGLGPEVGLASASAPPTPRSGAASESGGVGAHRKRQQGLFRGLRRKGETANRAVR